MPGSAPDPADSVIAWLFGQHAAMIDLLREIVSIDSGSDNKPGIDAVGAVLSRFLGNHGIAVETIPRKKHGDCLRALVPASAPAASNRKIVLLGHRDTVYPDGEAARRPFTLNDRVATGPGLAEAGL